MTEAIDILDSFYDVFLTPYYSMAQESGEAEGNSTKRKARSGLEKGGNSRQGEALEQRGRCDIQRGSKDRGLCRSRAYCDCQHLLHLF